jgi:hypothetical protein
MKDAYNKGVASERSKNTRSAGIFYFDRDTIKIKNEDAHQSISPATNESSCGFWVETFV